MLDTFPRDDSRRLEEKDVVRFQADVLSERAGVFIRGGGRRFKIEDIRNEDRRFTTAMTECPLGLGIDRYMLDRRQGGWKRHAQDVPDRIYRETISFPIEIMVVCNRGKTGLGNK